MGQSVDVSGSIGIALCPQHGADRQTLMRLADVALYMAKDSRRGFALYAPSRDTGSRARLALMSELRQGIEKGELRLHYQPKVEAATGRVASAEALLRWSHPRLGLLAPEHFVPAAGRVGLIQPLSEWVLREALRECRQWRLEGLELDVSVNLAARNLQEPSFPETLAALLEETRASPSWLWLEAAERDVMGDPAQNLAMLASLRSSGVRVALDNFGAGISSLACLDRVPADAIEMDRSLVQRMDGDEDAAKIVRSLAGLAHALGRKAVAEGVETERAWEMLVAAGCDTVQGNYFSPPLPSEDFLRWLRISRGRISGEIPHRSEKSA
jgi:EAL domain-containing protein (putative c-di-GMP-specific phosphodiesterase class I)